MQDFLAVVTVGKGDSFLVQSEEAVKEKRISYTANSDTVQLKISMFTVTKYFEESHKGAIIRWKELNLFIT